MVIQNNLLFGSSSSVGKETSTEADSPNKIGMFLIYSFKYSINGFQEVYVEHSKGTQRAMFPIFILDVVSIMCKIA